MNARDVAAGQTSVSATPASQATLRAEARAWVRKLKVGQPTMVDAAAFKSWRAQSSAHAQAWAEAARDWRDIGAVAEAFRAQQVTSPVRQAPKVDARLGRRLFLGSALGASGAMAFAAIVHPPLGLWPSWAELGADYRTGTGEQKNLNLPGGMQLMLNTQTSVSVQLRQADGIIRIELLAGELAVENHGSGFVEVIVRDGSVWMGNGDMEAKIAADAKVRVLCKNGMLELRHPVRNLKLQVHQQAVFDDADVGSPTGVDQVRASAWRDGVIVFNNTSLAEVVEEINRYRRGHVVLIGHKLAGRQVSGRFRIGALDEALVQIRQLFGTSIHTVGGVVLLG